MVLFVPSTDNRRFYKSFKISIIFWPLTISQNPSRYLLFWLCVWCVYCLVGLPLVVNNTALILSHHFNSLRLFLSREYKCHRGHNHNDQGEVEHCNRMSMMTLLAWVLFNHFNDWNLIKCIFWLYAVDITNSYFIVDWWLFIFTFFHMFTNGCKIKY